MQITSTMLRRIAAMPEQAMAPCLLLLAEQLEAAEARRSKDRERKSAARDAEVQRKSTEIHGSPVEIHGNASRVDNLPSLSETIETVSTPCNPPSSPSGLTEHPAFAEFWVTYPKRAGDRDRKAAVKAFNAQIKRKVLPEAIIGGAVRYAIHCDETGKTGTEFVRQARTWLNASGWEEPYEISRSTFNGKSAKNSLAAGYAVVDDFVEQFKRREAGQSLAPDEADLGSVPRLRQGIS